MTQPEFLSWQEFYRLFPFDDYHRFYRPAALISSSMSDAVGMAGNMQARLDWLQPDPREAGLSEADVTTLRAFGYKGKGG